MKDRRIGKGLIMRTLLDRCLSSSKKGRELPPEGHLAVYVGAARERFVVRTECVNHRLFRALLEEAEEARGPYWYAADGPLELPCDAGEFARVVEAIEREMAEERTAVVGCGGGGIVRGQWATHRPVAVHGRQVTVL
ncbi:auxin-responsive protein SAUR71-like [Phragmites australis]|uniref:auxin-responsive protein SAUR71-like n=1 Tax=Phragmites australis TaxID=29695 RepID=UPI002D798AC7|nr:auxin-responsive protein SAUR71-like [Phragmites australis]